MHNKQMFYREETPCADVSHLVLSFWEFSVNEEISAPIMHEVFPDGCISVVFYRNETAKLLITEIIPKSVFVPVNAGDTVWGMRILPEACALFFGKNPAEITKGFFENERLENELKNCRDFSEAVKVFEDFARQSGVKKSEIDSRLAKATQIFIESKGLAKIAETAKEVGLSERQFERNFQKASGLTPKQFARIWRFRETAIAMIKNYAENWANRAAENGYTDQAHLNRDFSNLTGDSPSEFAKKMKRISHGKLMK